MFHEGFLLQADAQFLFAFVIMHSFRNCHFGALNYTCDIVQHNKKKIIPEIFRSKNCQDEKSFYFFISRCSHLNLKDYLQLSLDMLFLHFHW